MNETSIPCNCFHSREDHKNLAANPEQAFWSWCRYSEIGQCPCDYFTQMSNIEYLVWKHEQRISK